MTSEMLTVERMKQVRLERGMTQTEMAKALKISTVHYARMEQGKGQPSEQLAFMFKSLFDYRPVGTREDALKAINIALKDKSLTTLWALADLLISK